MEYVTQSSFSSLFYFLVVFFKTGIIFTLRIYSKQKRENKNEHKSPLPFSFNGVHSIQGYITTTRYGVTKEKDNNMVKT